jgi:tetratricopeptide (TPR) repeat protein/tRNA A-37 threonylcarbamoyl transferase component Bud32
MIPDYPGHVDPHDAPAFAEEQIVSGRYQIARFLGRGGMGDVYEAEDLELRERIALKTLHPDIADDAASISRFKREIQLARKVAHPNVCRVFDLVRHSVITPFPRVIYFLTMELLTGETLEARIRREGPMTTHQAFPIIEQVSMGLDAAHQAGIIHRDFKPSNIMLVGGESGMRAVVTDFGLARSSAPPETSAVTETLTGHVLGTPGYIAPEVLVGMAGTIRSDIYALGVAVHRMITGALPKSPEITVTGLDPKWQQAIRRALDPSPENRFASASEFVQAIRGAPQTRRILARPMVLAGIAMVMIVLVSWLWQAWEQWRAHPSAEAAQLYRMGTNYLHAQAYFAASKALTETVRLAPHYSLAHARLAEAWSELELPEKADVEMLMARREGTSGLSAIDRMQIDAIDLSITREFNGAAAKYQEMLKSAGAEKADLYVDLGRIYEKSEDRAKALANYLSATKTDPRDAAAWLHLAALHSQALQSAQAQEEFQRAQELYQITSNLEGLTEVSYQRSADALRRERLEENSEYASKMLETARITGNIHQQIRAKLQLSSNASYAGNSSLAEQYARQAIDTARTEHIESLAIRGDIVLSLAFRRKRDFVEAEKYCREALAEARRTQSSWLTAVSLLTLAGLHDEQQRSEEAAGEAQEALKFFDQQHYARESLQCLALLGRWQRNRGDPAAFASFQRALDLAEKLQDSRQMTLAHASLGSLLASQERLPDALLQYQQSIQHTTTAEQIGYAALECAEVLWQLGRYEEAAAMFAKAEENAGNFATLRLAIDGSRAEMLLSQRRFDEAERLCVRTLAALSEPGERMMLTSVLGLAQIGAGQKERGRRNCEEALMTADTSGDLETLHAAQLAAAEARIDAGDTVAALALLRKVEPLLANLPLSRWRSLALLARSDTANRRRDAAAVMLQLDEIAHQWGATAFQLYMARPDLAHLLRTISRPSTQ